MSLILPLLLLGLQQQVAPTPDFIQRAIGQPTGKNGYEEYVAAAQIAVSPEYMQFENFVPGKDPKNTETMLDVWHEQTRRFAPIAELIEQGNGKQVYDPKPRLSAGSAPELAGFPAVADYFVHSAYVSLSNGDPQQAERTFEVALQFVYNLDNGTNASGTAAASCADRLFRGLNQDLPNLGVRELDRLGDAVTTILAEEPSPLNNLRAIRRADMIAVDRALRDPRAAGVMASTIQRLNGNQREATMRQFTADEDSYLQSVINMAGQPEANWERVPFEEQNAVAAGLARQSIAANSALLQDSAKLRTRLRILRLMARVSKYSWDYNQLPVTAQAAAKATELADPLNGSQLKYTVKDSNFDVSSDGSGWSGPVTLLLKK